MGSFAHCMTIFDEKNLGNHVLVDKAKANCFADFILNLVNKEWHQGE
jgi:hypothetical protein